MYDYENVTENIFITGLQYNKIIRTMVGKRKGLPLLFHQEVYIEIHVDETTSLSLGFPWIETYVRERITPK